MDTETTTAPDQRRTLIVAVVVAAIIAAIVWYGLFGRSSDTGKAPVSTPTDTGFTNTAGNFPITQDLITTPAPAAIQTEAPAATVVPTPQPQIAGYSVPTDADTGAGATILVTALTVIGVGILSLRRIT